ncbi:DUF4435 domain-containing protein [Clostridium tyrobutyricum]|uniref:DUF4435 domain-containing protein n=1 Tax=Clostridium tyrobutyricum TaxID=1519 RepID=UPI001C380277|nr:DUF4435 domain-containing protein [Clostridium tyrobutyricum]MBV4440189.1 DUF4435 domain-containing protein [Clostridium tyrobutyricum]
MSKFTIKFPNGEKKVFESGKPIVVLGANGAGKTRLSIKIEELNDLNYKSAYNKDNLLIRRISAQKSLNISDNLQIMGIETSEKNVFVGASDKYANKFDRLYNQHPATILMNDYDKVLSLLFAKTNEILEEQHKKDRQAEKNSQLRPPIINTPVEIAEQIWTTILPNRQIDLSGNEVHAIGNDRYYGKDMSDGERVILYMIAQVLVVKSNTLIIIDEPELHIHKAILNKLWDELENIRNDCEFMYITHDLDFAVSRNIDEILWVKSYNGMEKWDYEFLSVEDYFDLPKSLLFEILGTNKKIVFVEGTKDSLDYLLYQELYQDYHIIPCGGCQEVIRCVKAKKQYTKFNNIDVYGIIDRDYKMQNEIEELCKQGIFCLEVAEVENLFLVPELLEIAQDQFGCDKNAKDNAVEFIHNLFIKLKDQQIAESFTKEIDFQLNCLHFEKKTLSTDEIKKTIDNKFTIDYIKRILDEKKNIFDGVKNLKDILRVFNCKGLSKKISNSFKIADKEYPKRIINILKYGDQHTKQKIIDSVKLYMPKLS